MATLTENNQALETTLGLLGEQKSKADSMIHLTLENASSLASLNQELSELVFVLRQKNGQLASEMMAVAQDIRFDDLFRTRIAQGLECLERTQKRLQEFLQDNHYHQKESQTGCRAAELLADYYTMEEERRIHQEAILQVGTEGQPNMVAPSPLVGGEGSRESPCGR